MFTLVNGESSKEFSSLIYITKRINQETKDEYVNQFINQISDPKPDTKNNVNEEEKMQFASISEGLEVMKKNSPHKEVYEEEIEKDTRPSQMGISNIKRQKTQSNDMFEFNSVIIDGLKFLALKTNNNGAFSSDNDNISLSFDLDDDNSRELLQLLSQVTLPEIYSLKICNFYESDEDLEKFMENSLSSVGNFIFLSESFGVDIHDYLTSILNITGIKNLYLRGFMIDVEDGERIFSFPNLHGVTFESGNLGIDEDFCIEERSGTSPSCSILNKIRFIDDEMDKETMYTLLKSIKKSSVRHSLKFIELANGALSKDAVLSVSQKLGLSIAVQ